MEYKDIRGATLERGDHVAFALTRGGVLATGHVVETELVRECGGKRLYNVLRVRLDSNGRETNLPYSPRKFVVLEKGKPDEAPLATRVLRAMRQLAAQGLHNPDCADVRAEMGLPWSQAHDVYLALEDLHESGEIKPAAYPLYAFELTELGRA